MEPVTKKTKIISTLGLHDAIKTQPYRHVDPIKYIDSYQLTNIFVSDKDAARVKDVDGYHPLYLLCRDRGGDVYSCAYLTKLMVQLIRHYPDAVMEDYWIDGMTNPLHLVVTYNMPELILLILNKNRSLLNKMNSWGTPIHLACSYKHKKCVETILMFPGVNINRINIHGETAIFCRSGWEIISKLLQYPGIDVTVKDSDGNSPLYLFLQFVHRVLLWRGVFLGQPAAGL